MPIVCVTDFGPAVYAPITTLGLHPVIHVPNYNTEGWMAELVKAQGNAAYILLYMTTMHMGVRNLPKVFYTAATWLEIEPHICDMLVGRPTSKPPSRQVYIMGCSSRQNSVDSCMMIRCEFFATLCWFNRNTSRLLPTASLISAKQIQCRDERKIPTRRNKRSA